MNALKKFFGFKAVKIMIAVIAVILVIVAICNAVFASVAL